MLSPLATTGTEISKDLAVIKGQLAATRTRLEWIMVNHGEELLDHDFHGNEGEQEFGVHLWHLLLKLEIYREQVDKFTSSVRKKYGMPALKIRKDLNELRNQALAGILELQNEIKDMTDEEKMKFLDDRVAGGVNRKGILPQK